MDGYLGFNDIMFYIERLICWYWWIES